MNFFPPYITGTLINNEDLIIAIKQYIQYYEDKNNVRIIKYHIKYNKGLKPGIICLKYTHVIRGIPRDFRHLVILKVPSLAALSNVELKETNIFIRERYFYEKLLPEFYQLGERKPFAPQLYLATQETALVLENLSYGNFKSGDRIKQLDLDHSRASLDLLANYHAIGHEYLQNRSQNNADMSLLGAFQPTLLGKPREDAFVKFRQMVEPFLSKSLNQKLLKMKNEILADPMARKYFDGNSFTAIIHANFQKNNIFFAYNHPHTTIKQVKLIDWQLSREASPVLDLIYFFITSVPIEIIETNYDYLLDFYLEVLNNKLSALKSNRRYNRPELDEDMAYYNHYFLNVLCITWQQSIGAGPPGPETDMYIFSAIKWLGYLERKYIIER